MTRQFGKPDQERELVQINQVIDDCFLLIGEQLRLRDIQSKNECDPGLPRIMGGGDPGGREWPGGNDILRRAAGWVKILH